MKLEYIEYVALIEQYHSINKAAKALYVSQPFLSNVLRNLEKELGYQIFTRSSQGVTLTPNGKEFMRLGGEIQDLIRQMMNVGKEPGEVIRLNICYVQSYHVLDLLRRFHEGQKETIVLNTRESNNPDVYMSVWKHPEYLGLAYRYGSEEDQWLSFCKSHELEFLEFYREPVHAVVGKGNPLYDRKFVSYDDFKNMEAVQQKNWTENGETQIVMPDFMRRHFKLSSKTFNDNRSKLYYISKSPDVFGISVKWLDEGDPLLTSGALHYIPILDSGVDRRVGILLNKKGCHTEFAQSLICFFETYGICE